LPIGFPEGECEMMENGAYLIHTPLDEVYEIPPLFDINTGYKYDD
jgi:hypothetical protein